MLQLTKLSVLFRVHHTHTACAASGKGSKVVNCAILRFTKGSRLKFHNNIAISVNIIPLFSYKLLGVWRDFNHRFWKTRAKLRKRKFWMARTLWVEKTSWRYLDRSSNGLVLLYWCTAKLVWSGDLPWNGFVW